ncbi:hypothetical protein D3C74_332060 [compost metagenome]
MHFCRGLLSCVGLKLRHAVRHLRDSVVQENERRTKWFQLKVDNGPVSIEAQFNGRARDLNRIPQLCGSCLSPEGGPDLLRSVKLIAHEVQIALLNAAVDDRHCGTLSSTHHPARRKVDPSQRFYNTLGIRQS